MDWLRKKVTDYTPEVGRVFMRCDECKGIVPHYTVTGKRGQLHCACGGRTFRPMQISELRAAWWVLGVGLLWRKTILRRDDWDPRLPVRQASTKYA